MLNLSGAYKTLLGDLHLLRRYPLSIRAQGFQKVQVRVLGTLALVRRARAFQHDSLHELPEVGLEEEYQVTGETAHFEATSRPTGWGWLTIEGEAVERVRCWENE